jgi:NAD(P)-dependent dehydrogenase (short-subunit alcohol dehydrogenase family)
MRPRARFAKPDVARASPSPTSAIPTPSRAPSARSPASSAAYILVNNAGVEHRAPFLEITPADWQRQIDVNLSGTFYCTQAAAREMAERDYGRVVNLSSVAGLIGPIDLAAYGAAKAGIIGLTRAAALDLADFGITVNAIAPGPIETELMLGVWTAEALHERPQHGAIPRFGTVDEIAHTALFLASPDSGFITGVTISVDGGAVSSGAYMSRSTAGGSRRGSNCRPRPSSAYQEAPGRNEPMNTRSMRLIIVGAIATLVALAFAGPATARVFIPSDTQMKHGSSQLSDSAASPGGGTVSVAGMHYPKGTQVAPTIGSSRFVPTHEAQQSRVAVGYSSFPEVVRTMKLASSSATTASSSSDSFSWSNAGTGAGVAIGVIGILGLCSVGIRRGKRPVAA